MTVKEDITVALARIEAAASSQELKGALVDLLAIQETITSIGPAEYGMFLFKVVNRFTCRLGC
jgi:hypothetical protein